MVMMAAKCDEPVQGVAVMDAPCDKATGPSQCGHNRWTKLAKKRGKLVLRCQVCSTLWKTRPEEHQKCAAFHAGWCPLDALCPCPHIYARRERARPAHVQPRPADSPVSSDGDTPRGSQSTSPSTVPLTSPPASAEEAAVRQDSFGEVLPSEAVSVVPITQQVGPVVQPAWRYDPYA